MWHRQPVVAGSFYPSGIKELSAVIQQYLSDADTVTLRGDVVGIISPHAGYIYSGPVAAYSYKQIMADTEVAIVLAPSHRARFEGASVIPEGTYGTPLGDVDIDGIIGNALAHKQFFDFIKEAHQDEHSLEVQVPFLQSVLKKFTIVPIIVGTNDISVCREIAAALSDVLKNEKRSYVIVISTDLSHYYSYNEAVRIDNTFINALVSFDENIIKDSISGRKAEACGEGPILAGLMACKNLGARKAHVLKYANSGDTAGDRNRVVGYLAAALIK